MLKFLFIFFLSILAYKMIRAHRDPNLCSQPVEISYTEEEFTPLNEYGPFADYFKKLKINGSPKKVTKKKTEMQEICCPGYIMSTDGNGDCQPLLQTKTASAPTTTSTEDTHETETSTDSTSWSTWDDSTSSSIWDDSSTELLTTTAKLLTTPTEKPAEFEFPEHAAYVLCSIFIIVLVLCLVSYKRKQRKYRVQQENHHVKFDAEAHISLI
ncbi:uncharacterized protein [Drosophila pseudoobscura]|uniref:Uncharacterized protein n=1 Tax=Drosophila pseudoobscura pseudoobscura TaxID=46245 RepID=A0A6I8V9W8_DROPS|nr:uncharacterized protein LOC26532159 [Drosophila pseudoobscura]